MKLVVIILTACLMQVSAAGVAQKLTYSKKGATLKQIFTEIRKQTGYFVVYSDANVNAQAKMDVNFVNTKLESVLDALGNSQNLSYEIDEKNITIKPKEKSYLETVIDRFQAIDVRGKVVDSLGNGLAGATVSVKGGKQSTSTNNNGEFYLKNVDEGAVLVVSYLGYVTREAGIDKDYTFIRMQMSTSKLDEIQVVAYGNITKRLNTGTVTTINGEEIARQNINNPLLALQGKVPNLVITPQSGIPGANVQIQLRGENSFSAGSITERSTPLIIIDGVPFANNIKMRGGGDNMGDIASNFEFSALNYINPKDIESIDVLSDASATAIYGSRGGNGVILITTKKAKAGNSIVTANLLSGFSRLPANSRIDVLNTKDYLHMRREAIENDGVTAQSTNPNFWEVTGYAPDLLLWDQNKETDWQRELFGGNPNWTTAQLSLAGGTPAIQYRIGGTYNQNSYPLPKSFQENKGSHFDNGTVNFNLTGNSPNGRMTTSLGGSYMVNKEYGTSSNLYQTAVLLAPNAPDIYKENGELNWALNPSLTNNAATWINPFAELLNIRETNTTNLISNFSTSYKLFPEFSISVAGGYTDLKRENNFFNPMAAQDPSIVNRTGKALYNTTRLKTWTLDPTLGFIKKTSIGDFNVITGIALQGQNTVSEGHNYNGYKDDALIRNLSLATQHRAANSSLSYRYIRFFGRLNYNWENKYLINLTASRDGSSRFGLNSRFGSYWGIGSAWVFSEEPIVKRTLPFISFGKLRGSYGSNGSDGIGDYAFYELYGPVQGSAANNTYQGVTTIKGLGIANPNFSWENIKKSEAGLDLGFFNDRIILGSSYWVTKGGNQLANLDLPEIAARGAFIYVNQDISLQNSGWDFKVDLTNISTKTFSWKTSANFGLQYNKLLSIPEFTLGSEINNYRRRNENPIGKPISGVRFGSEYRGVDPTTGTYIFSTIDGNINIDKEYYSDVFTASQIFNMVPKTLGVFNTFTYKNFSLNLDFQLVKKKVFNSSALGLGSYGPGFFADGKGNEHISVMNRWTLTNPNAEVQKFTQNQDGAANFATMMALASSYGYTNASYIRLRSVVLNYRLPSRLADVLHVRNMNFSFNAQNLFTITGFKYGDPETQNDGVSINMPMLQTFTAGLSVQF